MRQRFSQAVFIAIINKDLPTGSHSIDKQIQKYTDKMMRRILIVAKVDLEEIEMESKEQPVHSISHPQL